MWLLLSLTAAQANPLVAELDFGEGLQVTGLPARRGPPGCAAHLEFEDPALGWRRYQHGLSAPLNWEEESPYLFFPPHDKAPALPASFCATVVESFPFDQGPPGAPASYLLRWRVVDGAGAVLTTFAGPYAIDALPLALALSAEDDYARGKADPACKAAPGRDCWTAFELWVYLEGWSARRCEVPSGTAEPG